MKDSVIKKAAKDYIADQLKQNRDWLRCITDSWIYDAEDWFCSKFGITIYDGEHDENDENDPNTIVQKFWKYALAEKDRVYEQKYGERDAFLALPGMIGYIKKVQEGFDSAKEYYIQDSPTRKGHCNHVLELLQQAIYEMEDLRIKSKERR